MTNTIEHIITFKGEQYSIGEPTVTEWQKISVSKEFKNPQDFYLDLISIATGLSIEELNQVNMMEILNVIAGLSEYYSELDTKFHNTFEFKGKEYVFTNLNELTFGHFVDIDTFTSKDEVYRNQNLNYFLALLYHPKDEDYYTNLKERTEEFKELPVKYFLGAQSFFLHLEQTLYPGMKGYSFRLLMITLMIRLKRKVKRLLVNIGDGIMRLAHSLKMMLPKSMK